MSLGAVRARSGAPNAEDFRDSNPALVIDSDDGSVYALKTGDYPVNQRMGVISVKDYGAKGDGSTDDSTSFQAALDAMASRKGRLYVPRGNYRITTKLTYTSSDAGDAFRLVGESAGRGASKGSFIYWDGAVGGTLLQITGGGSAHILDLHFNGMGKAKYLIDVVPAVSGLNFWRCVFGSPTGTGSACVRLGSTNIQVSEIAFYSCVFAGDGSPSTTDFGILTGTANAKNFALYNCNFENFNRAGFCYGDAIGGTGGSGYCALYNPIFAGNFGDTYAGDVYMVGTGSLAIHNFSSEGSQTLLNMGSSLQIGNNAAQVVITGGYFASGRVPADDYVIRTGAQLTLIGTNLINNRTIGTTEPKILIALPALVQGTVQPSEGSAFICNNYFENSAKYAPIYSNQGDLNPQDSVNFNANNRFALTCLSNNGGNNGGIKPLDDNFGYLQSIHAKLERFNGTFANSALFRYSGAQGFGWHPVTINYTDLKDAATTSVIKPWAGSAKLKVIGVIADTTTAFAGLAGTITAKVGTNTTADEFLLDHDVKTAVVTKGIADADFGASLAKATSPVDGGKWFWTATTDLRVTFTSGAGNFGNGSVTSLSAGKMELYFITLRLH